MRNLLPICVVLGVCCGRIDVAAQTISFGATQTSPGATVSIPVNLVLPAGMSVDSIVFGMSLNPTSGAPTISGPLTFQPDASLPPYPLINNTFASDSIAVFFSGLSPPLSGTVHLGNIMTTIPLTALNGQGYTAAFTSVSASLGGSAVSVETGPAVLVPVLGYVVGDSYPYTADVAGSFGDGLLNTLDLITALRAVTQLPGFVPAICSDRYDALDSFPVDTLTQRGGDGLLNTLDLVETLKRVTNLDQSRPTRLPRGLTCPAITPVDAFRRGPAAGSLWFGDAQFVKDGVVRVPVYLRAASTLDLAGLSFSVGWQVGWQSHSTSLQFVPAELGAPSLTDSGVTGAMAVAWLKGLQLSAGTVLIGYVQASGVDLDAGFSMVCYGVDANMRADGRPVLFERPQRSQATFRALEIF